MSSLTGRITESGAVAKTRSRCWDTDKRQQGLTGISSAPQPPPAGLLTAAGLVSALRKRSGAGFKDRAADQEQGFNGAGKPR